MKVLSIIAFSLFTIALKAQHKAIFSSQNYAGLLEGEQGSKFQLQTINGFDYKTWFGGLGTGIDWYYRRSIPVFGSINKDLLKKGNRNFYLAGDVGINFPWKDDKNYNVWAYNVEKSYPGLYWAAGLGYKIGIGKNRDALLVQLAYSYKHLHEKVKSVYYYTDIIYPGPRPDFTNRYDYYLRRLSLKLGWHF